MLDPSHKFYTQVQLQIYVCGAKNSDLVVFVNGSLLCLSVSIDQPFLDDVIPRIKTFWLQHIAPEILTRRLENRKSSTTLVPASNDKKLYCYCQEAWDQKSTIVGCDGANCKSEWIHLACIRPKRKTKK